MTEKKCSCYPWEGIHAVDCALSAPPAPLKPSSGEPEVWDDSVRFTAKYSPAPTLGQEWVSKVTNQPDDSPAVIGSDVAPTPDARAIAEQIVERHGFKLYDQPKAPQEVASNYAYWNLRDAIATALTAATEAARQQRDELVAQLVDLFGWGDRSYVHASMHVRNAVLNRRADLAVAESQVEAARREEREACAKHLEAFTCRLNIANTWDPLIAIAVTALAAELRVRTSPKETDQ